MDQPDESGPGERTTASPGDVSAQRARAPARNEVSASVSAATNGAGGVDAARGGRGFLAGVFSQATGARMARRQLATGDAQRERIEQDIHDGV